MKNVRQNIPTYLLYGEDGLASMPEQVHCEQIVERSRLHDWHISPHKHRRLLQFLLVQKGSAFVHLDGDDYPLLPGQAVSIAPGFVHGFDFSPGSNGLVVTMDNEFIEPLYGRFSEHPACVSQITWVTNASSRVLGKLFDCLAEAFEDATPGSLSMVLILAEALFSAWVCETQTQTHLEHNGRDRAETHFYRFEKLVNEQFTTHKTVQWYADQLGLSPEHLNVVCKQVASTMALKIIHQRIILEAKRMLTYTQLTIEQVSVSLGFKDPAYFSRFFKRLVGLAPRQYTERG